MTSADDSARDAPSPDEARDELARMLGSNVFRASPQLGAFLRFVVEAALQGRGHRIKAYTIAVEVLRRDIKFDPQIDPIVRVEATRLRRAIERYYAGPGAEDSIIIDLPRGSYVPAFSRRSTGELPSWSRGITERCLDLVRRRPLAACGIAIAIVAGVIAASALQNDSWRWVSGAPAARDIDARTSAAALPPWNGMPTIHIEPLRVVGTPASAGISAGTLTEKLNDAFARFDTVNVTTDLSASATSPVGRRSDYQLSGSVDYQSAQPTILFKLVDSAGTIVWSRVFDGVTPDVGVNAEDGIVVALANALLQSYGVIRSNDRAKHLVSSAGDPRYRCILEAGDAFRSSDPGERTRARTCLERLTSTDQAFAVGYAFLALIYTRDYLQQYDDARVSDQQILDKALRAARRAIELKPEDSRAYLALFVVEFDRQDINAAFAAAEKAMALNKYDMLIPGEYGGRLIMAGQVGRGLELMQRAGEYGAQRPAWHNFYLSLGNYLQGDMREAARYAAAITSDDYVPGVLAKALVAIQSGDAERSQQAINQLVKLRPGWREDPRAELARIFPNAGVIDRLARDLALAGLAGRS